MADYCLECSISLWGRDYGDLAEQSTVEDTEAGLYTVDICEGCGVIQIDHTGRCVSKDCANPQHEP